MSIYILRFANNILLSSFNTEIKNSIFCDALEAELYMKDDIIDIFWGQPIEERLKGNMFM